MALMALTRSPSPALGRCELTFRERAPIDVELAQRQHHAYELALAALGCRIQALAAEPDLPDAVFVEDTAVVLEEIAIVTRPGAESRQRETSSIARALEPLRELRFIRAPGTLDGGDVLKVGNVLYVGRSSRTNESGIRQLGDLVAAFGYRVVPLTVRRCLHLKSAVTLVAHETLLVNPAWIDPVVFPGLQLVEIAAEEPHAANALLLHDTVVYSAAYPGTLEHLRALGLRVTTVELSELEKAEGAVTCSSLILQP